MQKQQLRAEETKKHSFNHEPGQVVDKFPNYNMKILLGNFRELFGKSSGYQAPCLHEYDDQDTDLTTYLGPIAKCNNRSSSSIAWHCA
jgi:hypothetical protein